MQPLADCLAAAGVECLGLSLHGHGDNFPPPSAQLDLRDPAIARLASFRRVSYGLWRDETLAAYAIAGLRSRALGVPLLLAGFSLGALMGCTLTLAEPGVHFDRLILLAPALSLRRHSRLPRLLARSPRTIIPSLAPAAYSANRGTPVAAYMALYTALARLEHGDLRRLDVPALVLADAEDELVSYAGLVRLVERLPRWTLYPVRKSVRASRNRPYHLLLDAETVGDEAWAGLCAGVTAFVREPSS